MAEVLPQLLPINQQLLTNLQNKKHPRPLCIARIPPRMIRSPLHGQVSSPHDPFLPGIQYHLHLSLNHNPIIQTLGPVHHRLASRPKVHKATDGAVRVGEAEVTLLHYGLVISDVGVVRHLRGEGGGGVADGEGHGVVEEGRPLCGGGAVDDGLAAAVVGGDVPLEAGEVGGDLRGVGSFGRHDCWVSMMMLIIEAWWNNVCWSFELSENGCPRSCSMVHQTFLVASIHFFPDPGKWQPRFNLINNSTAIF